MVPEFTKFFIVCLKHYMDGKEHTQQELADVCINAFSLTPADCKLMTKQGNKTQLKDRVSWTHTYFMQAGCIRVSKKVGNKTLYTITELGKQFYNSHSLGFGKKELMSIPAFNEFATKKDEISVVVAPSVVKNVEAEEETPKKSPIEILEELSTHINETLEATLLEALKKMQPGSFEKLIKELLIKMKISSSEDCIELTPYVKDDGVDIYVYDNVLKMNVICCIQVKRYSDTAVGLSTVKELGGTLLGKNCKSGMVITTSQFTSGAQDYNPTGYNIQKIDGSKLTKLLISYGLGVKTKKIEVRTVDNDYLSSL